MPGPEDRRSVVFVQYLRPHGRTQRVKIDRSPEVAAKAAALSARGCVFEVEHLRTQEASLTVERAGEVVSIRVCANDEGLPAVVDELIEEAHERVIGADGEGERRR